MASGAVFYARLLAFLLLPATSLFAESLSTHTRDQIVGTTYGAVAGTVTDRSGGGIAGVTVTVSSPSLMGSRLATTGEDGHYLVPALSPGDYVVAFEHAGFQPMSIEARVGAGITVTADATLQIAGVVESVTVDRRSGAIDRHTTAVVANYTSAQLARLPASRSLFGLLSSTPGIQVARFDVGANTAEAGGPYAAFGTRGANRPMVEGIAVTQIFSYGFTIDYGSFEEVTIGLAAHGPQWPLAGVQMQLVAKSGGNQYHGTAYGDFEYRGWQAHNIDTFQQERARAAEDELSSDANQLWRYYDVNVDLGGFIARNHAWWYASVRDQEVQLRQVNFPVKPLHTGLGNYTGKATVRTGNHTFIGFAQTSRNDQPNRLDPFGPMGGLSLTPTSAFHESESATSREHASGIIWKAEWNATVGQRFFAEVRVGQFDVRRSLTPNGDAPRFEDIDTLLVSGGGRRRELSLRRDQLYMSASYFPAGWGGKHHIKVGGEITDAVVEERVLTSFPGNVLHVLRSGKDTEVYRFLAPSASASGLQSIAAYAGDTWRVNGRVTLNLGVRFDHHRVFLPLQTPPPGAVGQPETFAAVDDIAGWSVAAPRVGMVFDLSGDGKTFVKASAGRYWGVPADLGQNVNPNPGEWWTRYLWLDANRSGAWEAGEEGASRGTRGGRALESIEAGLKPPWTDEATLSLEQELPATLAVRSGVVWRRESRRYARQTANRPFEAFNVPVLIPDPGADGQAGTIDDGPGIPGYNLGPEAPASTSSVVATVGGPGQRFVTWDIAAQRRMHGSWSLSAGFAHTWHMEHANLFAGQLVRQNPFVLTPNDLINTNDGGRYRMRTWAATASGTFHAPWRIVIAPLVRHQSGQPFGRTISATMNYGTIRVLAEPMSTRRMDTVTLVDVRLEHQPWRSGSRHLSVFLDVFNLFNANPEQNINWASGSSFLQPLSVVSPRIARIGVRAAF